MEEKLMKTAPQPEGHGSLGHGSLGHGSPGRRYRRGAILGLSLFLIAALLLTACSLFNVAPKGDQAKNKGRKLDPPPSYAKLKNPIAPTEASLTAGRQLYKSFCQSCHGAKGDGRGPGATGLNPPPADFTDRGMMAERTDAALFWTISEGIEGTAMPAWKSQLSEDDRWHLVNYTRSFSKPAGSALLP